MATLDFSTLLRSSVGFDRLPGLLAHALERQETGYPPYDIEKLGDDRYRIVMAVAGFGRGDIEIVAAGNRLCIRGQKKEGGNRTYLYRGIATRPFERYYDLADFIEVTGATLNDGMLVVELKRELPEELKPRSIPINYRAVRTAAAPPQQASTPAQKAPGQLAA
jgi:molecular chaperone IbpA